MPFFVDQVLPWSLIGNYTLCLIFIELNVEVLDKMLEGECELRDNQRTIRHILIACVNAFLAQFLYFWMFLIKFGVEDRLVSSSSSCKFHKNWHRKGHPLHKGVMKLCPYFDFSSDRVRIQYRRSPVEATQRLWFLYICVLSQAYFTKGCKWQAWFSSSSVSKILRMSAKIMR
jgi:hypothetical protein